MSSGFRQDRHAASGQRDAEFERLKKERDELFAREKAARAEAETAQRRLSELSSMSKAFASSMRGVSVERQRARRRLNIQYAVGRILAESDGIEDAAPKVLETIGEELGWDLGALWMVDEGMDALRCYEVWRTPEHRPSGEADRGDFESTSRRTSLSRGFGLPGRVWERGEALWIEDVLEDEGFRRKEAAAGEGLRKAFAFPIRDGGRPLGVIEFFGGEVAPPDEDLLRTASLIGSQLGQFLERRQSEEEREQLFTRERAARAEVEESRERLREVLESIDDAFFALDRQWRLTYANDRAVSLTSWSREELLGKSVSEAFPELVEGMASAELIRAEKEGSATQFEHYSSRLDCWLSYRVYPSPTGLSIYSTDITGRKKAEKKLRAREEEYRTTFELAGVGKAQADLETGRFLRVNRRLCEITGYEPGELLARTFIAITHPEDQDRNFDEFRRMSRGETDEYETEKRYVRKDGAVVWVRLNATATRDPEGRPLRAVATIEDITGRKRAEEELKSSEELYRLIADNSTDMISKHTPEGVYTYTSPACRSLLGYEPEELVGHSAYEFFHPEDLEAINKAHSSVLELPDTYTVSYRIRHRDGSYLWFETSSRKIQEPETGAVREIIATSRDVTERKRMEEEKLQLAEHMRLLLESTDEGIYGVDLQGTCTFLNSSAAQMLGYEDPEELLGQDMHEICHHSHNDGSPYPAEECPIYQAFREERGVRVEDEVFWRRDGGSFPVEYSSSPIVEDGVTRGSIVTFVDITERKQAEEALRKSEERYRALYEDNPFMYFTVDAQGTVLSVNRSGARQLGYTVEDLVGRPMLDLFHEEDREGVSRYFSTCVQDLERPTSWEARKVRKDGSIMWVREHVRIVEGPDGDKIVLLLCEDITGRKQAEEQVLLQTQLLEQVRAAVIATDLQGTVTYWNEYAEELYGWSREEASGRNIMELTVSPEGVEVAEEIMERLRAGETWEGELVVRRKDGSTFPAQVTDSLIYDAQGHAVGVVGVSTDVTERKKAEEERGRLLAHEWRARAEAEERKKISRELHDRVAHSMAVVHQSLELYGAIKGRDPEGADRKLELARETTKTALKSTRDLSMNLRNEVEDGLSPAVSHLLSTVVPPEVHTEVSVEGDESLAPKEVRNQLFLILRESVRNAVSHAEAERISMTVEITPDEIFGSVEDDGRGFDPPEAHAGGGLESMRERAALIGGYLHLESGPNGTRIEVTVPLSRRG